MKKNNFLPCLVLSALLLFTFSSCNDDNDDMPATREVKDMLVDKKWKMQSWNLDKGIDLDDDGIPDTNLMSFIDDCDLDNTVIFRKEGKVFSNSGTVRCDADEAPERQTYDWTFDGKTQIVKLVEANDRDGADEWKILELTDTMLKVSFTLLPEDGKNEAIRTTMLLKAE